MGYLPTAVCFLIAGTLAIRGDTKEYGWFLLFGILALWVIK